MPVTPRRALPGIMQERQLTLASDDRTGSRCVSGREPAFDCTLMKHFPDGNRLAETLDRVLAEERKFKKIASELMRRRADEHAVGLCHGLKPGRQIGRIADNGLLSGGADAGWASRYDETGSYTHPRLQRSSVRLLQPSDLLHDFQAGPDGAIGRVLLRM